MMLIEAFRADPNQWTSGRLTQFGIPVDPDPILKVFLYLPGRPGRAEFDKLRSLGVTPFPNTYIAPVGAHKFGFIVGSGRASAVRKLAQERLLPRIAAAYRKLQPLNDRTAEETGAAAAEDWDPPLRGGGVRLALLDSGYQLGTHPDLPPAAATMDYADYPDTNADVADHVSGHGTHVAGTAFGNGSSSAGRWQGMAPRATPIYLKIGDDSTAEASSAAVVGAIRAAATWCDADVASMSYGGWDGFNDGSSPEEQAVDWAVAQGVTFFMSAGNSAGYQTHYSATVAPNSSTDPVYVVVRFAPDALAYWSVALTWYDGPDMNVHLPLSAVIFGADGRELPTDTIPQVTSPRGAEYREYLARDPLPRDSSSFFIRVTNHSASAQQFHLWTVSTHWFVRFARPDRSYTILLPSTADSCISVGAYTARTAWTDYTGERHDDRTVPGEIAGFSSIGPRLDDLLKPNITAPGRRTISCRDSLNVRLGGGFDYLIMSNDGDTGRPADYVAFMGTSMSSPAAAGTAALILEGEPRLTLAQLRQRIFSTARTDQFTGDVPNVVWGWGKIDVERALAVGGDNGENLIRPAGFRLQGIYPNPANGAVTVTYRAIVAGPVRLLLFDPTGRFIWEVEDRNLAAGDRRVVVPAEAVGASGSYIMRLSSAGDVESARFIIVK